MANTDRPHGFSPVGPILRLRPYSVGSDLATAIFIGDIVDAESDGQLGPGSAGDVASLGVSSGYHAALTASADGSEVMVYDDTEQLFEGQDDASATSTISNLHTCCDHIAGTGSTVTYLSGHEIAIDSSDDTTGALMLMGLVNRVDNAWGANADIIVQANMAEGLLLVAAGV